MLRNTLSKRVLRFLSLFILLNLSIFQPLKMALAETTDSIPADGTRIENSNSLEKPDTHSLTETLKEITPQLEREKDQSPSLVIDPEKSTEETLEKNPSKLGEDSKEKLKEIKDPKDLEKTIKNPEETPGIYALSADASGTAPDTLPFSAPLTPKGNKPLVDESSGSLQYSYPFSVAPGKNGLTPDLALEYSSQNTEESYMVGYGWKFNIPSIERMNVRGTDKLYTSKDFVSSVSGELVEISPNVFAPKTDPGEFSQYTFQDNGFVVKDKNGVTYSYGITAQARQDNFRDTTQVYKWMLEKIEDPMGNTIEYTYFKNEGQIYPQKIRYGKTALTDAPFEIVFTWTRNDRSGIPSYKTGFLVRTDHRLTSLQTNRKYSFNYATGTNQNGRVMLASIVENTGSSNARTTSFSYQTHPSGWTEDAAWTLPESVIGSGVNYTTPKGVELFDVNGDALPDYVRSAPDGNSYTNLNTGPGWHRSDEYKPPIFFIDNFSNDYGTRVADLNGDLLSDLLYANYSTNNTAYLNNGEGWVQAPEFTPPQKFFNDHRKDNGLRLIDVNGDGLADMIRSIGPRQNPSEFPDIAYLSDGTTFIRDDSWIPPVPTLKYTNVGGFTDEGTRFADVNHDGLVDIIQSTSYTEPFSAIYLNTGHGWTLFSSESPGFMVLPIDFSDPQDNAIHFDDLNGDGIIDISRSQSKPILNGGVAIFADTWINELTNMNPEDGTQWTRNSSYNLPIAFVNNTRRDQGGRIIDINGDGIQDIVSGQYSKLFTLIADPTVPDLLSTITLPTGGTVTVTYKASTQYKDTEGNLLNPKLPMIVQTVASITETDPFTALSSATHYTYAGGHYYYNGPQDRKFAGFEKVTATRPDSSKVITYYHQGNEANETYNEPEDHAAKIGMPYRKEIIDAEGKVFNKQTSLYTAVPLTSTDSNRFFVYKNQDISEEFNGNETSLATAQTFAYDHGTGNLTQTIEYGDVLVTGPNQFHDQGEDRRTTDLQYATNGAGQYKVSMKLYAGGTRGARIGKEQFSYDYQPYGKLTNGLLTRHHRWITADTFQYESYLYDATGFLHTYIDPFGKITKYTPDAYKLYPASITNPLNQVTSFTYDYAVGAPNTIIDANKHKTTYTYDGFGRILNITFTDNTNGQTHTLETRVYQDIPDVANKRPAQYTITKYLQPSQSSTVTTLFDGLGRLIQTQQQNDTNSGCFITDQKYDQMGNLEKTALPYGGTCTTTYNGFQAATNLQTTFTYDVLGRKLSQQNVLGTTTWQYDDRKTTVTDPLNKKKDLQVDAYGKLTKVTEYVNGTGHDTVYGYDHNNNLTQITDALGNIRNFTYDFLGNRLTATDLHAPSDTSFGTITEVYEQGFRKGLTMKPSGQVITYTYDDLNRLKTKVVNGTTMETYTYDTCTNGIGRVCNVVGQYTNETFAYDAMGRVSSETLVRSRTFTTTYTYDLAGNVLTEKHPNNETTTYTYTNRGLPKTITHQTTPIITNATYNALGQKLTVSYANGKTTTHAYDPDKLFQLKTIHTPDLQNTRYVFDAVGNLDIEIERSTNHPYTIDYDYDDLHRLTDIKLTIGTETTRQHYDYDILGNMVSGPAGTYLYEGKTATQSGLSLANPHATTSVGGEKIYYTADGNLWKIGNTVYTHNYNNEIVGIQDIVPGEPVKHIASYNYTPSGKRVAKHTTVGTNAPGGGSLFMPTRSYEIDTTNFVTIRFYLGSQAVASMEKPHGGTATFRYIHPDHLGGTRVVTDQTGNIVQTLYYKPFGEMRVNDQAGAFNEKRKFTGHFHDDETELEYMQARYYKAAWGRFLQQDPVFLELGSSVDPSQFLGDPQSLNSYAYARNNPVKYVDPTGWASALVIGGDNYGRSDQNAFHDKAQQRVQELKQQDAAQVANGDLATYSDGIYYVDGSTFDNIQNALNNYKDISLIEFYGHGDGNGLYLRAVDGRLETIYSNSWKGSLDIYKDGTRDHYVSELSKKNVADSLQINLYSCNARTGGTTSVAQSFANHFNTDVLAAGTYTNFRGPGVGTEAHVTNKYKWLKFFQTSMEDNGDFRKVSPMQFKGF